MSSRREFITLLGGRPPRGRSRRALSTVSACRVSVCLWASPKMTHWRRPTSQPSERVSSSLDGEKVQSELTFALRAQTPIACAHMLLNWWERRQT